MRIAGIVLLIIGIIVLLPSVAADATGIGRWPGFGILQIVGAVTGIVVTAAGAYLMSRKSE